MKRLLPLALLAAVPLAACGSGADAPPHHIVASAPVEAQPDGRTIITLPPITAADVRSVDVRPVVYRASRRAPRPRPVAVPTGGIWAALARCESGGNPRSVSSSGTYFGAFQFSLGTWHSLGFGGNPVDYPYETQLAAAQTLQARSGWGQWPVCARSLGLR